MRRGLNGSAPTGHEEEKAMRFKSLAVIGILAVATAVAGAQMGTKMVGGAEMFPAKNIIQNAMNSKDHTTLVAASAAGLVDTLSSAGPFTVFAPTRRRATSSRRARSRTG